MSDAVWHSPLPTLSLKGGGGIVETHRVHLSITHARMTHSPSPLEEEAQPVHALFARELEGANREERLAGLREGSET